MEIILPSHPVLVPQGTYVYTLNLRQKPSKILQCTVEFTKSLASFKEYVVVEKQQFYETNH